MNNELKVVTQNCFLSQKTKTVIEMMHRTDADIYCFQEITSPRIATRIKNRTSSDYLITTPFKALPGIRFHNTIFTKLDVLDSGELTYNHNQKTVSAKILWADIVKNHTKIRVFNCHFSKNHLGMRERAEVLLDIIKNTHEFDGPIVICGDMNTSIPDGKLPQYLVKIWNNLGKKTFDNLGPYKYKNEKYYFKDTIENSGFKEITDINNNTWVFPFTNIELFNLKLDWVFTKNISDFSYVLGNAIGDHKTIISTLYF